MFILKTELTINKFLEQLKDMKADLYLKTHVIVKLFFKAIKIKGANKSPLNLEDY